MRVNPCRYCVLHNYDEPTKSYKPGYKKECLVCENLKLHKEYLNSQRKFEAGELITSIDDLLKETWVIWHNSTKHIEIFKSMPLRVVKTYLDNKKFRKAIPRELNKE